MTKRLEDYPTPESQAQVFCTTKYSWDKRERCEESIDVVPLDIAQSLERRLAACREALEELLDENADRMWGISTIGTCAMQKARETLNLTK